MKNFTIRVENVKYVHTNHIEARNIQPTWRCIELLYKNERLTDENFSTDTISCVQRRQKIKYRDYKLVIKKIDKLNSWDKVVNEIKKLNEDKTIEGMDKIINIIIIVVEEM